MLPKRRFWKDEQKMKCRFTPPKRRFWKEEQKTKCGFRMKHFSGVESTQFGPRTIEKRFLRNPHFVFCSILPKSSFGEHKIVEALFKGESTSFGPLTIEKCFENPHFICFHPSKIFVWGGVKFMLPKRIFWKVEPTFQNAFPRLPGSTFAPRKRRFWKQ